jgi:hypothetical protein
MSLVWVIHQTSLASVKVAQRFADAVSDTTMLPKEQKVCPTKKPC